MDKNDIQKLGIGFVISTLILRVLFYKEDTITVFRTAVAFFWLFVVPGFLITYLWDFEFIERFVITIPISAALMGAGSYYLGLFGIHIKYSAIFLPVIFIMVGVVLNKKYGKGDLLKIWQAKAS